MIFCTVCKTDKDRIEFDRDRIYRISSGAIHGWCRDCKNAKKRARYAKNIEAERLKKRLRYTTTANRNRYIKDREKIRARTKTRYLLRHGHIKKLPCMVCGTHTNVQAHHIEYSEVYKVQWLCPLHHMAIHKFERRHTYGT